MPGRRGLAASGSGAGTAARLVARAGVGAGALPVEAGGGAVGAVVGPRGGRGGGAAAGRGAVPCAVRERERGTAAAGA